MPKKTSESLETELEKEINALFDEQKLAEGIKTVFPNGGKSGEEKRALALSCMGEIEDKLLAAVKGEGKANLADAIKKYLGGIAHEEFRAQNKIESQQAVDLAKVVVGSLRISEEIPNVKEEEIITPAVDAGENKKSIKVNPVGAPIEKKTGPEEEIVVPYEFAAGIREKYLEGKSGKKKAEAEERLARCAKEIGIKIAEMKKAGKDTDENQIVLSVIGKVKSLRAIFEADLKVKAAEIVKKDKLVPGAGSNPEQVPAPEDEKKSSEFSKFLVALEEAKKNCAEQKVQSGAVQLIRMSPRKFGIIDNAELKLAYEAREKAYREIIGKRPRPENQGDNLTLAEFQEEFGEFKKNRYNDRDERLNIQKYNPRSGLATIFIGEGDEGKEEVSVERLRELRAIYKNAKKKRKPESNAEYMTQAEFKAEFGGKVRKNLFDDNGNKMNLAGYYRSGEATVYFGENGDKENVSIERLRELLAVYKNTERKKKLESKEKSFREVLDLLDGLEKKAKADIEAALKNRKLSEMNLDDFLVDTSKLGLEGLSKTDEKKTKDLVGIKNEKIFKFFREAEITEKKRGSWDRFIIGCKENVDRAKGIKLGKIDGIDFGKMAAEGENIEVGNGYSIKLNDILNKDKKYPDWVKKEIETCVEEANKEISRRLDAKKAEMKKFLADNHEVINSRKMDEMDRRLWEQGRKTFEEVALKASMSKELDAKLEKIGYWNGLSKEARPVVLREKVGNFLFGKLVEKYALEAGEARKRTDEILAAIGESPSAATAKLEKNADERMEEVGQAVADRVFEKFGREIDLKIVATEKKPASGIERQSPVEKYPGKPASDAGDEEDGVYGGDIEPSGSGEEEDDVETGKGAVIEKVPEEEKIPETPQETVETKEEKVIEIKKEARAERADVPSEEQQIREKEIDPEKEERLQAFIKSYVDGGQKYKKLLESEKLKKIEAADGKEKLEKIKEMVGKMTLKTLDVLGRYSKEDREYVQKRVMEEIFG